jgi:chromosome segregation ATPase
MCKKLVIAASAVVVGLVVLRWTDLGSLIQVWWKDAAACCQRQIPPETRIKQLRLEIGKIDGDIKSAVDKLVTHEVAFKRLKDNVEELKAEQKQRREDMTALINALEQDNTRVSFKNQSLTAEAGQHKLDALRAKYEIGKESLKFKEQLLKTKTEQLELADQAIRKIKDKKIELTTLVEKLEAQLELVRIKQMDNKIEVSNSQVSKCEKLSENLKQMIAEEELRAEKYAQFGLTTDAPSRAAKDQRSKAESLKAAREILADDDKVAGRD